MKIFTIVALLKWKWTFDESKIKGNPPSFGVLSKDELIALVG